MSIFALAILFSSVSVVALDIHTAAQNGDIKKISSALEAGVDVDLPDKENKTALHFASERGHLKAVKFLIKNGANMYLGNKWGKIALHFASEGGHLAVVKVFIPKFVYVDAIDIVC